MAWWAHTQSVHISNWYLGLLDVEQRGSLGVTEGA